MQQQVHQGGAQRVIQQQQRQILGKVMTMSNLR